MPFHKFLYNRLQILTRKEEESVIPEVDREPEVMKVEDETSEMEVDESHMEIEVFFETLLALLK